MKHLWKSANRVYIFYLRMRGKKKDQASLNKTGKK